MRYLRVPKKRKGPVEVRGVSLEAEKKTNRNNKRTHTRTYQITSSEYLRVLSLLITNWIMVFLSPAMNRTQDLFSAIQCVTTQLPNRPDPNGDSTVDTTIMMLLIALAISHVVSHVKTHSTRSWSSCSDADWISGRWMRRLNKTALGSCKRQIRLSRSMRSKQRAPLNQNSCLPRFGSGVPRISIWVGGTNLTFPVGTLSHLLSYPFEE